MLRLAGNPAHSVCRLSQILSRLQVHLPILTTLSAHEEYFLKCASTLSSQEELLLSEVLAAKTASTGVEGFSLWVIPRFGTYSPWGTKALDILHHVGLSQIQRIEKALVYQLSVPMKEISEPVLKAVFRELHDRMTESIVTHWQDIEPLFTTQVPKPLKTIPLLLKGKAALMAADQELGLALSANEIDYLSSAYHELKRDPTDVELMMFAQANSEHCRHKIFKADWEIDGIAQKKSLFAMIQNTYQHHSKGVLSAYRDNSAVVEGYGTCRFYVGKENHRYDFHQSRVHLLMKVETHNHPTAIEPFAGAGTGQGGEIRDEGATGRGAKPKAGLTGFSVSHLRLPHLPQPWEGKGYYPTWVATPLEIMLKAPLGGAAFNNEFGRPNLCGYFRTYEQPMPSQKAYQARGYHKPVMIAGGMGNIADEHVKKNSIPTGALLLVIGGPAMKIGIGGGAASSMAAGASTETLDFASVQRQNPEMQRRCQEVIDRCWALGQDNPIISVHDVGAGGLANALPELVHDANKGATFDLRQIPNAELGMTPLEIWCNESQERYVLAILPQDLATFEAIANRERCPYAVVGQTETMQQLSVADPLYQNRPIDLPMSVLFGDPPKLFKSVHTVENPMHSLRTDLLPLAETIARVLQFPAVADKSFLITIGDRTVGGLTARDQMIGPWQVPVADCAVTATNYIDVTGEAMSMGERSPIAVINSAAAARMAVGEAILNIFAADVKALSEVRLSCNWMAAANYAGDDAELYAAVKAVGEELCPAWDLTIPVGKDSLSMRMIWADNQGDYEVVAPVTLVCSAFAPVANIRNTLTPLLTNANETLLILIDLAKGKKRLGSSIFAQVTLQTGDETPDVDRPENMKQFVAALNQLKASSTVLAYHDRSDGGLLITLCEMAFASHMGLKIDLSSYVSDWQKEGVSALFNEELGVVLQIPANALKEVQKICAAHGLDAMLHPIATINNTQNIEIICHDTTYYSEKRATLQALWSKTSYHLQQLRDNPDCAKAAYETLVNNQDPGLFVKELTAVSKVFAINQKIKPKVAILREQGVNGHLEMAAAFTLAGFEAIDVTMSDLLAGKDLRSFHGLAACGGFSYGDVLGAGQGWAKTILYQPRLRELFREFFHRPDTFTLGICNGCQMLSSLKTIIPGAEDWPQFIKNSSEQFEARLSLVEISPSNAIVFQDMAGSILPIVVSHGEGRANFIAGTLSQQKAQVALRYVDNHGKPTEVYPYNPNGSGQGMAGFTSQDGRATILMPHPERVFKAWQLSWYPSHWQDDSPWMRLFHNARNWLK